MFGKNEWKTQITKKIVRNFITDTFLYFKARQNKEIILSKVEPEVTVESAPVEIPTETAGAVNTADETSAETTVNDSTADKSLLEYNTDISVTGEFASQWKTLNVPGEYEVKQLFSYFLDFFESNLRLSCYARGSSL